MFAITGITGRIGGMVARELLATGQGVRAVVRDPGKGAQLAPLGCQVALADLGDAIALRKAFTGVDAVFVLLPPNFDPSPGYRETRHLVSALRKALSRCDAERVLVLSTVGAQATQDNLLSQLGILEQELDGLPMPTTFLRPAWFMDNVAWDVEVARTSGLMPSFLQPLDRPLPMVAALDVGRAAAGLLREHWTGQRIIELEGPSRISPQDLATGLASLLGRRVCAQAVPRDSWETLFRSQGMRNPTPRMRMLDGFNEGWLSFTGATRKGTVDLATVLRSLVESTASNQTPA
jgi:uncharacterized protein YbjT (DUF2867 family)